MLQNYPNDIKIGEWIFHEISSEDKKIYSMHMKRTEYPVNLWSANFSYIWAISGSDKRKMLWKMIDGMLVTFVYSYKKTLYLFCLPFGKGSPEKVVSVLYKAMKYCYECNNQDKTKTSLRMINDDQLEFLRESPKFDALFELVTWQGIERHFDIKKLVFLRGKEFDNIRNKTNGFHKENPDAKVCIYQKSDYENLLQLEKTWKNTFGKKYDTVFDGAYYKELVEHFEDLEQIILVIKKGEKIIGMISGSELPSGNAWGSVVKFDDGYRGLSETLIIEMAKALNKLNPEINLLNTGSDLGEGGLRNYKLKFRPVLNQRRYEVYFK